MNAKERNLKTFVEDWLPELSYFHNVKAHPSDGFMINTEEMGRYIFYPKSDRLLFIDKNTWHDKGLDIIKKKLLNV